jgi:hypothetical protein
MCGRSMNTLGKEIVMADMDFARMGRILCRCTEIAEAANVKAIVKATYDGVLKGPAQAFLDANRAVMKAESAHAKETSEAEVALKTLDQPYREARSVVKAFLPTVKVPMTLKQSPTDTDCVNAIATLIDVVDDHHATTWAAELVTGTFGQMAQPTIVELEEAIASSKVLAAARTTRAAAFAPAYEAYLRFKRVVRDAIGGKSVEYRRIHLRGSPAADADAAPPSTPG